MVSAKNQAKSAVVVLAAVCTVVLSGCTDATSSGSSVASMPAETPSETASPSPSSSGGPEKLEVIDDPCATSCVKGGDIEVRHQGYGPMTVIPYWNKRPSDDGTTTGNAAYALYQNDQAVGYVEDADHGLQWFGARPVDEANTPSWNLENESNVDKYGNVYLSYNGGVTVLTPTDQGYNSYGSMPSGKSPIENATLRIDPSGEPTLTYEEDGTAVDHHWDGNQFVDSTEF